MAPAIFRSTHAASPDTVRHARPASRFALRTALLLMLCAAGCGEGPLLTSQQHELKLSCPAGMVLIEATSFPSGPPHAPIPSSEESYDPAPPVDTGEGPKPTGILVPAYCIDRLAIATVPGAANQNLVSYAQAQQVCKSRGLRLCSPYEWELACRGRELTRYPYGNRFDPDCTAAPGQQLAASIQQQCGSSYGVYDQLGSAPEWILGPLTASEGQADPAQMGGLLLNEAPAGVDCMTVRLTVSPAAADGVAVNGLLPAQTPPPRPVDQPLHQADASGLAPVAKIRCCGDPHGESIYILDYNK